MNHPNTEASAHVVVENFAFEAVVDWITLRVCLTRPTNGQTVLRRAKEFGASHTTPIDKGAGGAATEYLIRVQEPRRYTDLAALAKCLDQAWGLAAEPEIGSIEVALDAYAKDENPAAVEVMTQRFMREILPPDVLNPRVGTSKEGESGLIHSIDFERLHNPAMPPTRTIAIDKTLYIGNHDHKRGLPVSDKAWRVYYKQTDGQMTIDGRKVAKPLPVALHRARVETTISGKALTDLGLVKLSDLSGFKFERLFTHDYFRFAKLRPAGLPAYDGPDLDQKLRKMSVIMRNLDADSPVCMMSHFEKGGTQGRPRALSPLLEIDTELGDIARERLRYLTRQFQGSGTKRAREAASGLKTGREF